MIKILSILLVFVGAVYLSLSFRPSKKILGMVSGRLRRKWLVIIYLMGFFLAGYVFFDILLITNLTFPVELVTAGVFLGGAVFVYLIINISQRTIEERQEAGEEVRMLNESLEKRVTERTQALKLSNEFNNTVMDSIADPISIIDVDTYKIIEVNQAFLREANLPREEILGKTCFEVTHHRTEPCAPPHDPCPLNETLSRGDHAMKDHVHWTLAGERRFVEVFTSPVRDEQGKIRRVVHTQRDVTERKRIEEALRESETRYHELSIVDDLTQLYNSRHFYHQLRMEIDRAERYDQPLTMLLFDIDNFKRFNDAYGHIEGNHVLSRLGQVVKRCLRHTDSAYRYGGEEFTVLLPMTTDRDGAVTAERIRTELKKELFFPASGQPVQVTVSIGLAQYKPHEDMNAFVHRVDQLMYKGKRNGKDRVCF